MRGDISVKIFTLLISTPTTYSPCYFRTSYIIENFINNSNIEQRRVVLKLIDARWNGESKSNISCQGAIKLSRLYTSTRLTRWFT